MWNINIEQIHLKMTKSTMNMRNFIHRLNKEMHYFRSVL